jgi:hypothetical protein
MDIICAKTGKHFNDVESLRECEKHCDRCSLRPDIKPSKPKSPKRDIFANVVWVHPENNPNPVLTNPMFITVKMLLADKRSWVKEYREEEYTCVDFTKDVYEFMTRREIRCGYTVIRFDNGEGHAIVAFETDYGLVFFEPQTGNQEYPQIGKPYGSHLEGVPDRNIITEIEIKWNC